MLNIQLIEASTDKHLWAERYKRETGDIFELQLEAYDYYLKAMEPFNKETREDYSMRLCPSTFVMSSLSAMSCRFFTLQATIIIHAFYVSLRQSTDK